MIKLPTSLAFCALLSVIPGPASAASICASDPEVGDLRAAGEEFEAGATAKSDSQPRIGACGWDTELLRTLRGGAKLVSLPNGQAYYPILLTDKEKNRWRCNHLKARIACIGKIESVPEGTRVTLTSHPKPPYTFAETILVSDGGQIQYQNNIGRFVLVERTTKKGYDIGEQIVQKAEATPCGGYPCSKKRLFVAERLMIERIRINRQAQVGPSPEERLRDAQIFLKEYSEHKNLQGDKLLIHRAIIRNEIGLDENRADESPFALQDAVVAASGPSFGAHQIDVGQNKSSDRIPFRRAVHNELGSNRDPALRRLAPAARANVDYTKGPLEKPIREYDIRTFAAFYRSIPLISRELRSEPRRREYYAIYSRFLEHGAGCVASLRQRGGVFARSAFARFYVIDVRNQFGDKVALKAARRAIRGGEEEMKEYVRNTSYGKRRRDDVDRRIKTIERVAANYHDQGGGNPRQCDLPGLRRL